MYNVLSQAAIPFLLLCSFTTLDMFGYIFLWVKIEIETDHWQCWHHFLLVFKHFWALQIQMIHSLKTSLSIGNPMRRKQLKQVTLIVFFIVAFPWYLFRSFVIVWLANVFFIHPCSQGMDPFICKWCVMTCWKFYLPRNNINAMYAIQCHCYMKIWKNWCLKYFKILKLPIIGWLIVLISSICRLRTCKIS